MVNRSESFSVGTSSIMNRLKEIYIMSIGHITHELYHIYIATDGSKFFDKKTCQKYQEVLEGDEMTQVEMAKLIDRIFTKIQKTREAGQKEYARNEDNAFANFERVAEQLNISKTKVLMTYLLKHIDGINSYTNGHKSQREDITGRLTDAIVYLCLLWGMISDKKAKRMYESTCSEVLAYEDMRYEK